MLHYSFLTVIDVVIFYLITYALLQKRFEFSFETLQERKRMIKIYGVGILATFVLVLTLYIGGTPPCRFISIVVFVMLIKLLGNVTLRFSTAIYIIVFVILILIQTPLFPLFMWLGLDMLNPITSAIGQIITLLGVFFIYHKIRLHKILWLLEQKPALKLFLFALVGVIITIIFLTSYNDNLWTWLHYLVPLGILIIALIQVAFGIGKHLNPNFPMDSRDIETIKKEVLELVDEKRKHSKQDIILDRFNYMSQHSFIVTSQLNELIESLLDHAISMQKDSPIVLGISVIHDQLQLIIKHECTEQAYQLLRKQDTVKKIKKAVLRHKGFMVLQHTYERTYETSYAVIIIKI